jgi:hypothetical protein
MARRHRSSGPAVDGEPSTPGPAPEPACQEGTYSRPRPAAQVGLGARHPARESVGGFSTHARSWPSSKQHPPGRTSTRGPWRAGRLGGSIGRDRLRESMRSDADMTFEGAWRDLRVHPTQGGSEKGSFLGARGMFVSNFPEAGKSSQITLMVVCVPRAMFVWS